MAFTKALYYPEIDIEDEAWLKNAMFYWEEIQTIVPSSIKQPYKTSTGREFHEEGMLTPYYVQSDMKEIEDLTDNALEYLQSSEGMEFLMSKQISRNNVVYLDKLPRRIRELVRIYPEKLPEYILFVAEKIFGRHDEVIAVDSRFADFYMTLLATHISERIGAGLLTNKAENSKLANLARLDARFPRPGNALPRHRYRRGYSKRDMPRSLAQGALVDFVFKKIHINPSTSVKKIIKFRKDHADELGRFRTSVGELTKILSRDLSEDQLHQQVNDIYLNEVRPAVNDLKSELKESKIKHNITGYLRVISFSTIPAYFLQNMAGLSESVALLVDFGVSLTACAILYNTARNEILRKNPFSYLLAIEREVGV